MRLRLRMERSRHTGESELLAIVSQSCCTGSAIYVWRTSWGRDERREEKPSVEEVRKGALRS
jgi:hypothetical protein